MKKEKQAQKRFLLYKSLGSQTRTPAVDTGKIRSGGLHPVLYDVRRILASSGSEILFASHPAHQACCSTMDCPTWEKWVWPWDQSVRRGYTFEAGPQPPGAQGEMPRREWGEAAHFLMTSSSCHLASSAPCTLASTLTCLPAEPQPWVYTQPAFSARPWTAQLRLPEAEPVHRSFHPSPTPCRGSHPSFGISPFLCPF